MAIDKERLIKLKEAGLLISEEPFVETHITCPGGYIIGKPKSAGGNSRKNCESHWSGGIISDAPACYLYEKSHKYFFVVHKWIPGPGWGDFEKSYGKLEEAIEAIIDYYFGDPITMNPPPLPSILSENGNYCAKCGNQVLKVTSNLSWQEAKEFLSISSISNKEELINSGFLPTGIYCSLCGSLEQHHICAIPKQIYEVYLISLGSERKTVIVKLHQILNISLLEAKNLVNSNNNLIFSSDRFQDGKKIEFICSSLSKVGAKIKLRVLTEKFGSSIVPYEVEEFTVFD